MLQLKLQNCICVIPATGSREQWMRCTRICAGIAFTRIFVQGEQSDTHVECDEEALRDTRVRCATATNQNRSYNSYAVGCRRQQLWFPATSSYAIHLPFYVLIITIHLSRKSNNIACVDEQFYTLTRKALNWATVGPWRVDARKSGGDKYYFVTLASEQMWSLGGWLTGRKCRHCCPHTGPYSLTTTMKNI